MFSKKPSGKEKKKKKKPLKKLMNLMKSWGHKMKKKPKENAAKPKIPIQITDNSPDLHWDETMFDVLKVVRCLDNMYACNSYFLNKCTGMNSAFCSLLSPGCRIRTELLTKNFTAKVDRR